MLQIAQEIVYFAHINSNHIMKIINFAETNSILNQYVAEIRAVALEAQLDIMIEFVVADKSNNGGHALSHNGCHSSTGSTELREAKQSKDHDRIQNDICDGTAKL